MGTRLPGLPRRFLPLLVVAASLAFIALRPAPASESTTAAAAVPDDTASLVVGARTDRSLDAIERYVEEHGFEVRHRAESLNALRVDLAPRTDSDRALALLLRAPGVTFVEPLYAAFAAAVPPDPLYASRQAAYLAPVNAPAAWDITTGRTDVIVAVIDTGVDASHPDLRGRLWFNGREVPANGVDDDANGCIDDLIGCAFVSLPEVGCTAHTRGNVADDSGHGTFVSGIIAANADGTGMVGVAHGASVMTVKVLDCNGGGNSLEVAQGIIYAAVNGAKVINVSLGGPANPIIVAEAVRIASEEFGALVVAASGNSGDEGVTYPARYPQTLAVGAAAAGNGHTRAPFSTYGPEVDVAVIGEGVVGTVPPERCGLFIECLPQGPYAVGNGTSFAAPQVAGLVALLISHRPGMSPEGIIEHLRRTATPVSGGPANWAGAGLVDMLRALSPQFRLGVPGTARN